MNRLQTRKMTALAGVTLAFLFPLVLLTAYVASKYHGARQALEQIQPRYARLLGLEASRDELGQAQARMKTLLLQRTYSQATDATQAGNDAQQRIRDIFTGARLSIVSSQVLPPKQEKNLDRVPLSVRAEGDLSALQAAVTSLAGQTPSIFLEGLSVQNAGTTRPDGPVRLAIQFNLYVLRVRS